MTVPMFSYTFLVPLSIHREWLRCCGDRVGHSLARDQRRQLGTLGLDVVLLQPAGGRSPWREPPGGAAQRLRSKSGAGGAVIIDVLTGRAFAEPSPRREARGRENLDKET